MQNYYIKKYHTCESASLHRSSGQCWIGCGLTQVVSRVGVRDRSGGVRGRVGKGGGVRGVADGEDSRGRGVAQKLGLWAGEGRSQHGKDEELEQEINFESKTCTVQCINIAYKNNCSLLIFISY